MQVLSYVLSNSLEVDFVLETVNKLIIDHKNELSLDAKVYIHSDQGCHYTSIDFRDLVEKNGLTQSMSRKGNCWDNAPQESFFGHMKDELHDRSKTWTSIEDVRKETESADYAEPEMVITIPAGVGLDTLRIAMEEGTLIMTDITAGSVTIQSGGGNLIMRDVSLGTVDIYTDAGEVALNECTFNSLNIGMGDGAVTVDSEDGLARCRMEIKTGDGEITYNGASQGSQFLQPGNGKRFLTIQVGSGDISISG